jgi:DNA-binding transcriptional regulator YiaG
MTHADDEAMSKEEYRSLLEQLELNQRTAADVLGITLKTSQNYANGVHEIPLATAKLLRLWAILPKRHRPTVSPAD